MLNKFITLYPKSESEAKSMICNLTNRLSEFKAPKYYLTITGMHSPVHYRYGAFLKKQVYDENKSHLFIARWKRKNYVEDKRQNFPSLPSWNGFIFRRRKGFIFKNHMWSFKCDSAINKYKIEKNY